MSTASWASTGGCLGETSALLLLLGGLYLVLRRGHPSARIPLAYLGTGGPARPALSLGGTIRL